MKSFRTLLLYSVVLLSTVSSCQDYVCIFPEESLSGIQGRLWFNPNPIIFPAVEPEEIMFKVMMLLSNIGSEGVLIESIDYWGDGNIGFPEHVVDAWCPNEFHGFEECDRVSSVPESITYVPRTGYNSGGTIVIQTSDPTSPTLEVPIILDPEAVMPVYLDPEAEIPVGNSVETFVTCPLVKPNPIRFKQIMAGRTQTLDVCVRFEGGGPHGKITKLEAHGRGYSIQKATDHLGNSISLPVEDYTIGQNSISVRIVNQPFSNKRDGGTLLVQTLDDLGEERTLLVPILDDM